MSPVSSVGTAATRVGALRVPELTALFWIVKVLSTGTGETTSDYFVLTYDPVPVVLVAAIVFVACFAIQFRARRYVPWRYWLFVTMVAIFGTMVADVSHVVLGIPYAITTTVFALALVVVLLVWRSVEGTIDVHSITTGRRELFYWLTVLATFALGTALGDQTASTLHLGYLLSGVFFAVMIVIPGIAFRFGLSPTAAFWWAYVLTRPLGASFSDWLAVAHSRGGLALGTLPISIVGLFLIAVGVVAMQFRRRPALASEVS